ncbi:MAG: hypothetical protein JO028_02490, partial [Acidobacteriaceae bacterium]|nr:hypothetical protein [Acidobacteriaceae bacterium]
MNASICAKAATLFYLIVGSSTGWAAPILSIEPAAAVVPAGPFSVDINIANVTDLFAFQFDLTFTPGILAASGSAEGPFLATSGAGTTFFSGRISSGTIRSIGGTLLGPTFGASGSGKLATVDLVGIGQGITEVTFSNVLLLNSSLQGIATTTTPSVVTVIPEPAMFALDVIGVIGITVAFHRKRRCALPLAAVLCGVAVPMHAANPGYRFTILAKTGDLIDGHTLTTIGSGEFDLALNNTGEVAFRGFFGTYPFFDEAIFTPSQFLVGTGDVVGGYALQSIDKLALNNSGTLLFVGSFTQGGISGQGIFTQSELLIADYQMINGRTLGPFITLALNDSGTVAFLCYGGIATLSEFLVPYYPVGASPRINNSGTVVFSGLGGGVQTPTQVIVLPGSIIAGKTLTNINSPRINDAGTIVFAGNYAGRNGIFTPSEFLVGTGDVIGGSALNGISNPYGSAFLSINNPGVVLFRGAIFTTSEELLSEGDTIEGLSIEALGNPAFNDAGIFVVNAALSDGNQAIVMGAPISSGVPGDVNGDGVVDCTDVTIVRAA